MTHLLVVMIAAFMPLQESVKGTPAKDWLWLFTLTDPDPHSLAEWAKLNDAVPSLQLEFETIMNDPACDPRHLSGLYGLLNSTKVDRKRFLKPALRDLNHTNAKVRRVAATYVGDGGGGPEFAAPLMMLMLHDPDADVCNASRRSLGKVGDATTLIALEHLIRFDTGKSDKLERAKSFANTRDEIKARLAAATKPVPAPPK